jgi:tetratricopeptide (TPR) repeat protein
MTIEERQKDAEGSEELPDSPETSETTALYEAGLRHMGAGSFLDAQVCCRRALALDADHADTLHLMGLLSFQQGFYDDAVEWISRAIRRNPRPDFLSNLGTTLKRQGRHEEAVQVFDKAIQLKPDAPGLWTNLGHALVELRRPAEAELAFQHALKLDPIHAAAADAMARLLNTLKRPQEALTYADLADRLQPNKASILSIRAIILHQLKRFQEAIAAGTRAHALEPANVGICTNIGLSCLLLCRGEEALTWLDRALVLQPDVVTTLNSRATALRLLRRFDEAIATYARVKALDPENVEADLGLGHMHLSLGNFEAGWIGYEARLRQPYFLSYPKLSQPMWRGEASIAGKTVLICADEGLGDQIQFARYVPMVAALGAQVILVVEQPLQELMSTLPGVSQCLPKVVGPLPPFDLHCPLSSLPMMFRTRTDSIPAQIPYLSSPAESRAQVWENRLGPHDRLRVGLVWSGNPGHGNDHNRSIPFRALIPLLECHARFVSLQKDPRPEDRAALRERADVVDLTDYLSDFTETAALISRLDLVITVCTSVAHLAGALGHPTWILLPYAACWRWQLDCEDSPWYPTVRLFRQTETCDYGEVVDRVRDELNARVAAWSPGSRVLPGC